MNDNLINQLIKDAGFSSTFEKDRLIKLMDLVVKECVTLIDKNDQNMIQLFFNHFGFNDHEQGK